MLEQLIFSWVELPVRDSASRESREDSTTREVRSASPIANFLKLCVPDGSYGRTFRGCSAPTEVRISGSSSGKLMKSGIVARGECWTLSTCEWTDSLVPFLKEDGVCSLSDILETGAIPPRYYLSRKSCLGILRRAASRGRELPAVLQRALEAQAGKSSSIGQANAEVSEAVSPALTCDHEAPIAFRWADSPSQGLPIGVDYCHTLMRTRNGEAAVLCYENHAQDSRVKPCGECSPQLNAKAGTGGGNLPLVQECFPTTAVRRLLPVECERLMGFPDNWTRIPWRGKPEEQCPDSPRYVACGNSMCVNVMRWIGMRIEYVERKMSRKAGRNNDEM